MAPLIYVMKTLLSACLSVKVTAHRRAAVKPLIITIIIMTVTSSVKGYIRSHCLSFKTNVRKFLNVRPTGEMEVSLFCLCSGFKVSCPRRFFFSSLLSRGLRAA